MKFLKEHPIAAMVSLLFAGGLVGLLLPGSLFGRSSGVGDPLPWADESQGGIPKLGLGSRGIVDRVATARTPTDIASLLELVADLEKTPTSKLAAKLDKLTLAGNFRHSRILHRIAAEIALSRGDEFALSWLQDFPKRSGNVGIVPLGLYGEVVALEPRFTESILSEVSLESCDGEEVRKFGHLLSHLAHGEGMKVVVSTQPSGVRAKLVEGMLQQLQASNPAQAWAVYEQLTNDYPPGAIGRWAIPGEVIAQAPEKIVSKFLNEPGRQDLVKAGLSEWGEMDPAAAIGFFLSERVWKHGAETVGIFSEGLSEATDVQSLRQALKLLELAPTSRGSLEVQGNIAVALLLEDPASVDDAGRVLSQIPEGPTRDGVMSTLARRVIELDNAEFTQKIRELNATPGGSRIAERVIDQLRRNNSSRLERLGIE